ncbi:zinc-finger domain-containing protein [Ectothiorhodospira lacustris]|uniref:zinc-finger domain-containing protein n=1 Tax=Ectothiorhodospira lacustris TaxID=2899127 RepID=UPI001EE8295B|nr:zinc-finger domain-containing protein [Ectothiorhodospira lacustris]MCG5501652.1 zinc-finger domain-containing protein [Ectothiorhodospira lacustris]MCG5509903.1 zinc-finger domain-containing protein [Ectothiorhodospira lacustris]MCG5521157.1 zinc-finger domain-containing protein [Ectothiorhodospira lacustris]
MPNPQTALNQDAYQTANTQVAVSVSHRDLPLHCPAPGTALWASHPRVYLPIQDAQDGRIVCPYCSTVYTLED